MFAETDLGLPSSVVAAHNFVAVVETDLAV